jgi:hypothetical protein
MTPLLTAAATLAAVLVGYGLLALRFWLAERADDRAWQQAWDAVAQRYDLWTDTEGRQWATEKPGWRATP